MPAEAGNGTLPSVPTEDDTIDVASFAFSVCLTILLLGTLVIYALRYFRIDYTKVPDSYIFLLIGALTAIILDFGSFSSHLERVVAAIDESFPEIFFAALLPPIVFQSGFELNVVDFFRSFGAICVFAFLGTCLSAVLMGGLLWGISQIPMFTAFSGTQALLLGTVLSATDTVAVIAVFDKLRVADDLYALVFGESVLNDAVAIVLFRTLVGFETSGTVTASAVFKGLGMFLLNFLGSMAVGTAVGVLNSLLFKYVRMDHHARVSHGLELEKAILFVVPYISYMTSEAFHLSGVVSIVSVASGLPQADAIVCTGGAQTRQLRGLGSQPCTRFRR
jgi:NhaP-type Na+/H+ or K+/H+ antiporter